MQHISNNMLQCSNSSSGYLTTFLVQAAPATCVQTPFHENPIAGPLGQATRGCLAGTAAQMPAEGLEVENRVE